MAELLGDLVNAPLPTVFILAGIVFLLIAVVGNVSGKIEPGTKGRVVSGIIGFTFVAIGFTIYLISKQTPTPLSAQTVQEQLVQKHQIEAPATSAETRLPKDIVSVERHGSELDKLFTLRAVIDDPDGYTNVRSMKSASSDIVTKVHQDEEFYTYKQDGNWWQIRTKDEKIGYMHISRIKLIKDR